MSHLAFHPFFSSFPLALFTCAVLAEVLGFRYESLRNAVWYLLFSAVVMVSLSFCSGYFASYYASQTFEVAEDMIAQHHRYGKITLVMLWLVPALKLIAHKAEHARKFFFSLYFAGLIISEGMLLLTGYWGAWLVFVEGAGVVAH